MKKAIFAILACAGVLIILAIYGIDAVSVTMLVEEDALRLFGEPERREITEISPGIASEILIYDGGETTLTVIRFLEESGSPGLVRTFGTTRTGFPFLPPPATFVVGDLYSNARDWLNSAGIYEIHPEMTEALYEVWADTPFTAVAWRGINVGIGLVLVFDTNDIIVRITVSQGADWAQE